MVTGVALNFSVTVDSSVRIRVTTIRMPGRIGVLGAGLTLSSPVSGLPVPLSTSATVRAATLVRNVLVPSVTRTFLGSVTCTSPPVSGTLSAPKFWGWARASS